MSSINSIGSGSSYSYTGNVQRQGRDPAKIADSVFAKLDTKNQGYLEVSDLEAAFSNISSSASSSTTGASSANSTSGGTAVSSTTGNSASIDDLFKKLDSNGDGKVTKDEFSAGIKNLSSALDNQFHARRAGGGHRPPPPQDGGGDNGGLDKTQLSDLATTVGKSNNAAGAALTQVAQNFDAADTNQDGKVSFAETLAYLEKSVTTSTQTASPSTSDSSNATNSAGNASSLTSTTGTSAASATNSSSNSGSSSNSDNSSSADAALFKKALQLLRAYSAPPESSSQGISVSA